MASPSSFGSLIHIVANLYVAGGLAVGMALLRELYPEWAPGFSRAVYDLLLMGAGLFFTLGVVFYLTSVGSV